MRHKAAVSILIVASILVPLWIAGPSGTFGFLLRSPIVLLNDLLATIRQVFASGARPSAPDGFAVTQPVIETSPGVAATTASGPATVLPPRISPSPAPLPVPQNPAPPPVEPLPSPDEILPSPDEVPDPVKEVVDLVVDPVQELVDPIVDPVQDILDPVVGPVEQTLEPVLDQVESAPATVEKAAESTVDTVEKTTEPVRETVDNATGGSDGGDGPVQDTVDAVKDTLGKIGAP